MTLKKHFRDAASVETIKKQLMILMTTRHPAVGGNAEDWAEIEREYLLCLQGLDRSASPGSNGEMHTYYYNEEQESETAKMAGKLLGLGLDGVRLALIGKWLWLTGETRQHAATLKGLGLRYSGDKQAWYWHLGGYKKRSGKTATFAGMAAKYGYREIASKEDARSA